MLNSNDIVLMSILIPLSVILGAVAVGVVAMVLHSKGRERLHRERMFLAEKGLEIPQELYGMRERKRNGLRALRVWLIVLGTLMIFIGIGAMVAIGANKGYPEVMRGMPPVFIGLGLLVSELLVRRWVVKPEGERSGES